MKRHDIWLSRTTFTTFASLFTFADVELELPALLAVAAEAPDFERADLGHLAVQVDRHGAAFLAGAFQGRHQRRELFDLIFPFFDEQADGVAATRGRAEKTEGGLFADDEAELLARHVGLGAFFHAEGDDAKRLDGRGGAGDGGQRGLDADV